MPLSSLTFKGTVYLSKAYKELMLEQLAANDNTLFDLKEAFKTYWSKGFAPIFGQDTHFVRPEEIRTLGLRKVHVRQDTYSSGHGYSSTKKAWDNWAAGSTHQKPASNSYLIYSVTDQRDAVITAFIDDGAHKMCDQTEYMDGIIDLTLTIFSAKKFNAMPIEDHNYLFDDKWLNVANEDEAS